MIFLGIMRRLKLFFCLRLPSMCILSGMLTEFCSMSLSNGNSFTAWTIGFIQTNIMLLSKSSASGSEDKSQQELQLYRGKADVSINMLYVCSTSCISHAKRHSRGWLPWLQSQGLSQIWHLLLFLSRKLLHVLFDLQQQYLPKERGLS